MLKLEDFGKVFLAISLVGSLLLASPSLALVLPPIGRERFSELYVLGPERLAENYPFNVKEGGSYLVYVGVVNHMGSASYYVVYVKFRNQFEALPNATSGVPSSLQPLYEYRVFLRDGEVWEVPLKFSFSGVSFFENRSLVAGLVINDVRVPVDKMAFWDEKDNGYYYQLFIELWIYNSETGNLQFHNRFVSLWLNMTSIQ